MRTMLATLAVLALVPATAFADDSQNAGAGGDQTKSDSQPAAANGPRTDNAPPNGYVVPQSALYEGGKIPEGATIEKRPNLTLVGTGLAITGVAYAASLITSIVACPPQSTCSATQGAGWLYLPVVGPFVTAAMATSPGGAALAAFDGGIQVLGATLALAGILAPKKFVVWQDKTASLKVTPMAAPAPAMGDAKSGMTAGVTLTLTHL